MSSTACKTCRPAAEGTAAAAATARPQGALQPRHLGAAYHGGVEEAGGGTAGGGECNTPATVLVQFFPAHSNFFSLFPPPKDAAFCAKVHGKLNKVSTASAAAAESLDNNHLRLMLVNGRIIR